MIDRCPECGGPCTPAEEVHADGCNFGRMMERLEQLDREHPGSSAKLLDYLTHRVLDRHFRELHAEPEPTDEQLHAADRELLELQHVRVRTDTLEDDGTDA